MFVLCLTGCGNKSITKVEYIYPTVTIPKEPTYYNVNWQKIDGKYCLSIEDAKNLLKNFYILKTYKDELKSILKDLQNLNGGKDGTTYP